MKNGLTYLITTIAVCALASAVQAHDDDFGTVSFPDMSEISIDHDDSSVPLEQSKGWVYIGAKNDTNIIWTDFHFEIKTADVIFDIDSPNEPTSTQSPTDWTLQPGAQILDADFPLDPILPGEIGYFGVYTDNTVHGGLFTICFTPTPEPASMSLLALGSMALIRRRR